VAPRRFGCAWLASSTALVGERASLRRFSTRRFSHLKNVVRGHLESDNPTTASNTRPAGLTPRTTAKRKFALVVGYLGAPYHGFQRNYGVSTVEGVLIQALVNAGFLAERNTESFGKMGWQRAARTDRSVSALGQVVSVKLELPRESVCEGNDVDNFDAPLVPPQEILNKVNQCLPREIVLVDVVKVTNSFRAKDWCEQRRYSYLVPLQVLLGPDEARSRSLVFRETELNSILHRFIGSHRFDNFTAPGRCKGRDLRRKIISFDAESVTIHDTAYVRFNIVGGSFLYHQIRKIMGLVILVCRRLRDVEDIDAALQAREKFEVPIAPAHGLLLEECLYPSYDKRFGSKMPSMKTGIEARKRMENLRESLIHPHVMEAERVEYFDGRGSTAMERWLDLVLNSSLVMQEAEYDDEEEVDVREMSNPRGGSPIVP